MPIDLLLLSKAVLDSLAGPELAENLPARDARIMMVLTGIMLQDNWMPLDQTFEQVNHELVRTGEVGTPEQRAALAKSLVSHALGCFAEDFEVNVFLSNNCARGRAALDVVEDLGVQCVRDLINCYSDRTTWRETSLSEHIHGTIRDFCGKWYESFSPIFREPAQADAFMGMLIDFAKRKLVERSPQEAQRANMMEPIFMSLYEKMKVHYANLKH